MKKLFCLLLIAGVFVAFTSCKKTCNCDVYLNGVVIESYPEFELAKEFKKCTDLNTIIDVPELGKTGWECK
jgi:hypothetical protein